MLHVQVVIHIIGYTSSLGHCCVAPDNASHDDRPTEAEASRVQTRNTRVNLAHCLGNSAWESSLRGCEHLTLRPHSVQLPVAIVLVVSLTYGWYDTTNEIAPLQTTTLSW